MGNVTIGIVPDTRDFYAGADLVVMLSRVEGLSIAAIEAACVGIPLILSDIEPFKLFSGKREELHGRVH